MGFLDKMKNAAAKIAKNLKHVEFELTGEELFKKWSKLQSYSPEIHVGNEWYEINRVTEREVEVGLFRKSKKTVIEIEYILHYEYYDEEEEERSWWEDREDYEARTLRIEPKDKVKIRLTEAKYEKMKSREGNIL